MSEMSETGIQNVVTTVRVPPPAPVTSSSSDASNAKSTGSPSPLPTSNSVSDSGSEEATSLSPTSLVVSSDTSMGAQVASSNRGQASQAEKPIASSFSRHPEIPQPTDSGEAFNSTISITLDWKSPMIAFDTDDLRWKLDPNTNYRIYPEARSGTTAFRFVGVGYLLNGKLEPFPTTGPARDDYMFNTRIYTIGRAYGQEWQVVEAKPDQPNLGEINNLNLSAYHVEMIYGDEKVEFHNLTVDVPLRTQAENFSALQSLAKATSVIQGDNISPFVGYGATPDSVVQEMQRKDILIIGRTSNFEKQKPLYYVNDDHLVLRTNTEISYQIPFNTTLVEVLGPVGSHPTWLEHSECYAYLNPRPSWWLPLNYPIATSRKAVNATDQTVFLFPLDPSIAFELRVGVLGNATTCPISAFRNYPFHADFSMNNADATSLNSSATDAADIADTNPSVIDGTPPESKKTNTTPIIVGVVLGVVGGLILLSLAFWLLRRHKRNREAREQELLPEPFTELAGEPRTKAELEQIARGEDPSSVPRSPSEASDEEPAEAPRTRRGRRVVQEEDAESIEYLPPQYREAWHGGARPMSTTSITREDGQQPSDPVAHQLGDASTREPIHGPALEDKVRKPDPSGHQTDGQTNHSSDEATGQRGTGRQGEDLRAEYKRWFGKRW